MASRATRGRDRADSDVEPFALALTPLGRIVIDPAPPPESVTDAATVARLRGAFAGGAGPGLFHLGAVEAASALPPACAFWRDFGRSFMTRLCAAPAVDDDRDAFDIPCPGDTLADLIVAAPPMTGAEYLSADVLETLWAEMRAAATADFGEFTGTLHEFLHAKNPVWNQVGRVHFHLAERRQDTQRPFAFLATYTTRLGPGGKMRHLQLGKALEEYAGARNKGALLSLLRPVRAAASESDFLRDLVDSGRVFHPLAWSPAEAHAFLREVPAFEVSGIVVRVPDWWKSRESRRPRVQMTVGASQPSRVGLDALLDFSIELVVDGEPLSIEETRTLLEASDGLVSIKGHWVELDRAKLEQVLAHWRAVEEAAGDGVTVAEAMRLVSGAALGADDAPDAGDAEPWSTRVAGPWLAETLAGLTSPDALESRDRDGALRATLRPYQEVGVRWLLRLQQLGLGACLADDMGLGKTIQVLALLLWRKRVAPGATALLVVPASLIANWTAEIERFAPSLRALVAHPSAHPAAELRALDAPAVGREDVVITSYGYVARLPWARDIVWDVIVADEAQALKNPSARQTKAAKALSSRTRVALTGTPVENRLADLWSLFDFVNPGLLGSARTFKRFAKGLAERSHDSYGPLRELIGPYLLRRLKTDRRVIADLPDKTEVVAHCSLTRTQAGLYQKSVDLLAAKLRSLDGIQRRGVVLSFITRFKQICNHPSQWLGDGAFEPADSGKFARLREICEEVAARQEKALVFTQFREMTAPLAAFLAEVFGRSGLVLHGATPVAKRRGLVDRFQRDEAVPFFVLSLKAGGTGLNLTAASHVIHFDRWWNPAVENQATDRAFRIGQKRNVLVHKFTCRGTVEEKIDAIIRDKQALSDELIEGGSEALLTEMSTDELIRLVSLDVASAMSEE